MTILVAVKKWSSYLIGKNFKINIDHQSLKFLLDSKTTTPAQQQWVLKMIGFDYEVVYQKGSSNGVVDALSRRPSGELQAITLYQTDLIHKIKHSWHTDISLQRLIT